MKLYDAATAPNPRRVRVFIAEKGLDVPCEQVDIMKAVNRGEEFRRNVNPMGTLPVLELDDGTCIAETGAVCRYFEEVQPDPPLLGVDAKDKAVVEMWNRRMELELFQPATLAFQQQHEFFKGRVPQVPEYAAVSKAKAEKTLAWLDGVLADREYIAGARFTVADIVALCAVDFGRVSKIKLQPDQKNLARWHEQVSARPSAKA